MRYIVCLTSGVTHAVAPAHDKAEAIAETAAYAAQHNGEATATLHRYNPRDWSTALEYGAVGDPFDHSSGTVQRDATTGQFTYQEV